MKQFDLYILDKNKISIREGDILGIITTKRKGFSENGRLLKKKVVFGYANTDDDSLSDYIGFWLVDLDYANTNINNKHNYYEEVTSIKYWVNSFGAEIIGNVYDS